MMSVAEILASVETSLGEAVAEAPRAVARGGRVSGWSAQLLDPAERKALRSLAVFVGGFDAEAAQAVAPGLSIEMLGAVRRHSRSSPSCRARGAERGTGCWRRCASTPGSCWPMPGRRAPPRPATCATTRRWATMRSTAGRPSMRSELMADLEDDYANVRVRRGVGGDRGSLRRDAAVGPHQGPVHHGGSCRRPPAGPAAARAVSGAGPGPGGGADHGRAAGHGALGIAGRGAGFGRSPPIERQARRRATRGMGPLLPRIGRGVRRCRQTRAGPPGGGPRALRTPWESRWARRARPPPSASPTS